MKFWIAILAVCSASLAQAGFYEDRYCTTISYYDRFNSKGVRLTTVAQIIQTERANYHLDRHRDPGDQGDFTFDRRDYRAALAKIIKPNSAGPILTDELLLSDFPVNICVWLQGSDMPDLGMVMEIWRNE